MKWRCVSVMAALVLAFGTAVQADTITHGGATIDMDFVTVGYAGNTADTHGTGYGAVGYNYRIGKYEVTADQWAAVIAEDSKVGNAGEGSGLQPTFGTSWYVGHDARVSAPATGSPRSTSHPTTTPSVTGKHSGISSSAVR